MPGVRPFDLELEPDDEGYVPDSEAVRPASGSLPVSEQQLQRGVIELARALGWRVAHFRPGLTKAGNWVTAVEGDGKGFPDLVLVRPPRVIFAELKSEKGRKSLDQDIWIGYLTRCPGVEVALWRPEHWQKGEIEEVLRGN